MILETNLNRVITLLQVLWFSFNCMGRVIQGLVVTTLEITTLAFIFVLLPSWYLWWHKPMDVKTRHVLRCSKSVAEIQLEVCVSVIIYDIYPY
jgi:hypothetical protein